MVFSSVPIYLDPPNWNQHVPNQAASGGGGTGGDALQLQPGMAAPASESGMAAAVIRPGSMAERARLAKVPQPDPALKCPRCDSTNTKFCYFNNYSLSQPRHFCKTCRRYWTRGGALRNVPVGGGCRRNKRSKAGGSSSKSSASTTTADHRQSGASSSSSISTATGGGGAVPSNMLPPAQLPFMALHSFADYGAPNLGLNFSGFQSVDPVEYQMGNGSSVGLEQWRFEQIQQFPFLGGLEPPPPPPPPPPPQVSGLFPFDAEAGTDGFLPRISGSGLITQLASVKMEDHPHGLNLPRQFLGLPGNDQYWGGGGGGGSAGGSSGGWALDFSGFNSSTSANLL